MSSSHQISLQEIGIPGSYTIAQIPGIELHSLPHWVRSQIVTAGKELRTSLDIQSQLDHGSYGNVYEANRGGLSVLLKQPRMAEMNLLQEAVLQHLAHKTLESKGLPWAIPKVYDVFWKGKEIWFSMEKIKGISVQDWFAHTATPDKDTFFLLAQLCFILAYLEVSLNLDIVI